MSHVNRAKSGVTIFSLQVTGGILALLLAGFYFAYFWDSGISSHHRAGHGAMGSTVGYDLGFDTFILRSDQSIVVNYELKERKSGYLYIYFWGNAWMPGSKIVETVRVLEEKTGEYRFRPRTAGVYRISFRPMPDGNGYDFFYKAKWRRE